MVEFGCLATAIGSLPHTSPEQACSLVMKYLGDMPCWPQLPRRSPKENMVIQFSEGFPGLVVEGDKVHVAKSPDFEAELERIYADCEQDRNDGYGISAEYAAGLYAFLSRVTAGRAAKGQVTGPVTWCLRVTRQDGLGIIYDDTLSEAAAKFLRLKASWQEAILRTVSPTPVVFIDEPYLVSLGSVFVPVPEEKVPRLLEEVLKGVKGIKGLHCCGNTDWSAVLDISIDILSFDAYNYASSLAAYADKVRSFLERGGGIAWGIVPNDEQALAQESLASLRDRLEEAMAVFTRDGLRFRQLVAQGLITPSCGLAGLSLEAAARALELTAGIARLLRARYSP